MENVTTASDSVIEKWSEQKKKLKAKISILTGSGFNYEDGKKDDILKKVQIKLGKTKEELLKIISEL